MKLALRRVDWIIVITALLFAFGCSGGGCGGCATFTPIPGGFPPAKRAANAVQARVTSSAISFIESDPAKVLGSFLGGGSGSSGVVEFDVPSSCSGDPYVCCDSNHNAVQPCGPVDIDLTRHSGDPQVLVLAPAQGAQRLQVTINSRIKTKMDLPFEYSGLACGVSVDSTQGSTPYFTINAQINFSQDATAATTRITASNVAVTNVEGSDISLNGHDIGSDIECGAASFFLSFATSLITDQLASQIQDAINNATCKSCPSGDVAECGSSFATACTNGTCMEGSACLQELGLDGRMAGTALFGGLSPGTTGKMDLYEVAGGYATSDSNGIALGLLGGMEPAGSARDQCGPPSMEPALATIPLAPEFQGNTVDLGSGAQPFDIGFGLHQSQLDALAYASYNGGLECLTIGHSTVSQLTTDTIGLLSRSLTHLVSENSPMAVGLRPQSPPTITLGKNTFTVDGMGNKTLVDPLLDVKFKALEIDFFAQVDQQWIRVFTVVADVHLPVGLDADMPGKLTPVIGNPMDAFTNISVKNSDAVTESPDTLAGLFPSLLGVALPQLSNGLSPISLPALGGLVLDITAVTSIENNTFLAIFANLAFPMSPRPVHTTGTVVSIENAPKELQDDPRKWTAGKPSAVTLQLGGNAPDLEFQIKLDGGTWSPWSRNPRPVLQPQTFWLPGMHKALVRARQAGHPETTDNVGVELALPIAMKPQALPKVGEQGFHGSAGATGCGCDSGRGGAGTGALMAFVLLFVVAPMRKLRRKLLRLGRTVWLTAIACLPACDCGDKPCGSSACMPGEVSHAPGKWTSITGDDKRVMVATYDPQNGDLVIVDATDTTKLKYKVVDGLPAGATPTYDPSTYRGGLTDAGPDVGAWTSISLFNHVTRVAYQDRDAGALKYAAENGGWHNYTVDEGGGHTVGEYANLIIDSAGHPAIAYLSLANDDGMGHMVTNLQLARASKTDPGAATDWTISTIASEPGTCAGLCGGGQVCIDGTPQTCVTPGTCASGCGSGTVCVNNACVTPLAADMVDDLPTGTGLWVSMVNLSDGRLAAAYYDQVKRALVIATESAPGTSMFTEQILDGNVAGADRGMWVSAVAADDGTVHLAYQDALGDQLMYTSWNGGTAGTPEVVDDGERPGDRPHPVGAGNAIYLLNGTPAIAYQDGMVSDVYVATRSAPGMWSTNPLATGPLLDGFSIGATTAHGSAAVLAWDLRDPSQDPPNGLQVMTP